MQARALGQLTPADRDALWRLMPVTSPPEARVATGRITLTPPATSTATADPTCSPGRSSLSGLLCTSLGQTTRLRARGSCNQAVRSLDPSSIHRDPTTPCQLPPVPESLLTTGSATVKYASLLFFILTITARARASKGGLIDSFSC